MAQLSDDCFAFGGPMMSVDEAVAIIASRVTAVQESESVPLAAADGRVLAREVGFAIVHAAGARTSDDVVFAHEGDMTLLGAHTIEGMNLRVDLKQRRLVPAGPVPAAKVSSLGLERGRLPAPTLPAAQAAGACG